MLDFVIVKILYAILVLSTVAIVGVAVAIFWRVRRHLSQRIGHSVSEPPGRGQSLRGKEAFPDTE